MAGRIPRAALAAKAESKLPRVGDTGPDAEAPVSAASTYALGKYALRVIAGGLNTGRAGALDRNVSTSPATASFTAKAQRDVRPACNAAGDAETAVSAASTKALRQNARRAVSDRGDRRTGVIDRYHGAIASRAAGSSEAQARRKVGVHSNRGRHAEAAIASTASHTLRQDAGGIVAVHVTARIDHAGAYAAAVRNAYRSGIGAGAAVAPQAQRELFSVGNSGCDAEAAVSASTSNALCQDAL
jgi:hypothetical protein